MSQDTKIIFLTESVAESWKRDASSFALAFACFLPGWYLQMVSMTILGLVVFVVVTMKHVFKIGNAPMTIEQAKQKLAEMEKEKAQ